MKFQILQENIQKAVTITSRFASNKTQLPILGNILLSATKSKIYISSTNLEISASVQVGAKVEEEGDISVPSKVIAELVGNLPKETINISSETEHLKISAPGFSSTILGINSSDFPKIINNIDKEKSTKLQYDEITKTISQVLFAASSDETRPILTGVLVKFDKDTATFVSTDGFRLSQKKMKANISLTDNVDVVIPKSILGEILRVNPEDNSLYFDLLNKEKQVIFGVGDTVLTSRLLEGEYPDFEKILPKSFAIKVLCDKEELLRAVKLASIFARESANVVKLKISGDFVFVSAESSAAGNQETKIDAKIESAAGSETSSGQSFEIAFNYKFLEDFLHSVVGEEVKMEFTSTSGAGVFKDTTDENYLHLIMPVKV